MLLCALRYLKYTDVLSNSLNALMCFEKRAIFSHNFNSDALFVMCALFVHVSLGKALHPNVGCVCMLLS
jgi:hypothetical protein